MVGHWAITIVLVIMTLILASCRRGDATSGRAGVANGALSQAPSCEGDSLRPSTAAPAEGLWLADDSSQARRIAVMVGPTRAIEGDLRVLRRLEVIEVGAGGDTVRHETTGAAVHLELVPARPAPALGAVAADAAHPQQPVATYAVGTTVIVAAYEACATGVTSPRLRYIRHDAKGRVVTDVMLQRVSRG
jgi:hypothetical protein